jgi:hypothetical protein
MIFFTLIGIVVLYMSCGALYAYYRHGFHPPGDAKLYRNSAWLFTAIGVAIVVGSLVLPLG